MKQTHEQPQPIDFDTYCPTDMASLVLFENQSIPVPQINEFPTGMIAQWKTIMNRKGTIISNLVHREYPGTYCQIQMAPDDQGTYHTFMVHQGEIEDHIPEHIVNNIFLEEMGPQIMTALQKLTRHD